MVFALLLLLVAGCGGGLVSAQRWLWTGSSALAFPWAAAMVLAFPLAEYLAGGESTALLDHGWTARGPRWFVAAMVALLVLGMGRIWADGPPLEEPRRGASRLGRGTFLCALVLLGCSCLGLGTRSLRHAFEMGDEGVVLMLGLPASFLVAAGTLNLTCFFAAWMERRAGGRGPTWNLGSALGFLAVAVYALRAIFEAARAAFLAS